MNELIRQLKERMGQDFRNDEHFDVSLTIKRDEEDNVRSIAIFLKAPKE